MKIRLVLAAAVGLLAASAFADQSARPPPASSVARGKLVSNWVAPVVDLSNYVTLPGAISIVNSSIANNNLTNNSGIGNRIGVFKTSTYSYGAQSSFVRSKLCVLGTSQTNDNETLVTVDPVAGPYGDGTFVWRISAGYRPDMTGANCYFNGNAGIFNGIGFQNYDNVSSVNYRNNYCSGYYCSDRTVTTQVNPVNGESTVIGDSTSAMVNRQCEVNPYSCAPPEPPPPPPSE